jgi:hypothetical protein
MEAPAPGYPKSKLIKSVRFGKYRPHKGDGDMWPITWAADDYLYGGAGDNSGSAMNFWRIHGKDGDSWSFRVELVNNKPVDPAVYCQRPRVNPNTGVKPASLLGMDGILYFAVELHNYGENPAFNRQCNINSWIITSRDWGKTWDLDATPVEMFTGRLASPHFLQFGKDYAGARDEFVYAYFPAGEDGKSYWCNADMTLLGRVPRGNILDRSAYEFFHGTDGNGGSMWSPDGDRARPVFAYPRMTGENHVSYNPVLKRYFMANFSFLDRDTGQPRPYHQKWPESTYPSQLTLFEAPEPWGPWSLFHRDDDFGHYGVYQPSFPTKWMAADGKSMYMVYSGSYDDYNFTCQKMDMEFF